MVQSRWLWQLVAFAVLPALGCGLVHRPYANDPILRERDAVWGDPARARSSVLPHLTEPSAPQAPSLPPPLPEGWVVTDPITSQ